MFYRSNPLDSIIKERSNKERRRTRLIIYTVILLVAILIKFIEGII